MIDESDTALLIIFAPGVNVVTGSTPNELDPLETYHERDERMPPCLNFENCFELSALQ